MNNADNSERYIYVFWMNIGVEKMWMIEKSIIPQINVNKEQNKIISDTEQMCLLLKEAEDIVILKNEIPYFLEKILEKGKISSKNIIIPQNANKYENISEAIVNDTKLLNKLKALNKKLSNRVKLFPYAVTDVEEKISRITQCELIGPSVILARKINSKINSRHIAKKLNFKLTEATECFTFTEVFNSINRYVKEYPNGYIAVKENIGSSGKGIYLIKKKSDIKLLRYLVKHARTDIFTDPILVEKWYEKAISINYQIYISNQKKFYISSITEQVVKDTVYIGSEELIINKDVEIKLFQAIQKIAKYLIDLDYKGIVSIDGLIINETDVIPILEINGRMSLSTYPVLWKKRVGIESKISFFYFDIAYNISLENLKICINKNLLSLEKQEGIIPYVYSPSFNPGVKGRIFIMIVGKTNEYINMMKKEISTAVGINESVQELYPLFGR